MHSGPGGGAASEAPHPEEDTPRRWTDVLLAERRQLNPAFIPPLDEGAGESASLARLNRAAFEDGRAALCLSGGGIRSASFAVGVLQALAERRLLRGLDYLSTVSGGGFAGAWLSAWLHRAGQAVSDGSPNPERLTAEDALHAFQGQPTAAAGVEPWPVARLRLYTRYLSPETGFFSADFWGLVATMLRNTILNWAVLLPVLGAAMLVPRLQFALIHVIEQDGHTATSPLTSLDVWALAIATLFYGLALVHVVANLPSYGNRGQSERQFLARCLLPLSIGTLALTYYWATWTQVDIDLAQFTAGGALVSVVIWAAMGLLTGSRPFRPRTWIAAASAGAIAALAYQAIFTGLFSYDDLSRSYVALAFPLVMGALLLYGVVFVGLAGREVTAADLEWWSRAAAWNLIVALAWLGVCAVAFGVPLVIGRLVAWAPGAAHALGGAAATLAGITSWLLRPTGEASVPSWPRRMAIALVAPVTVVLIAGGMAMLAGRLVTSLATSGDEARFLAPFQQWPICDAAQEAQYALHRCHPADSGFAETVIALAGLLALGLLTSRLVPANKFSLHDMYHHRLARAYLGASRDRRRPNAFTGFDPEDDLELAALAGQRPFHVVNATLNTRLDPKLGRQETRAFSFTFSPLHAGSHALGAYRPSGAYAYDPLRQRGISLGSAITISGAAASPQMGEFTSPSLAFLLAMFNARLGVWLGNPGEAGRETWRGRDPKGAVAPIVREMLGWTTDANPYVYLSDGGHFDNLGLWEMVLRRVRDIVIVDSGCDPEYRFEDLATAVRRARVDHGAEIAFDAAAMNAMRDDPVKPHVITGTIRYLEAPEGELGSIVYIKPALSNDEPVDVVTYRKAHPDFPHESTANQWFTEAQFESYRALGFHSVQAALADQSPHGLGRLAGRLLARQVGVAGVPA
jgi:hypothetical protein